MLLKLKFTYQKSFSVSFLAMRSALDSLVSGARCMLCARSVRDGTVRGRPSRCDRFGKHDQQLHHFHARPWIKRPLYESP